jgi:lipoprotein-anchoring transpeptidase ErfK/SrfK
MTRLRLAFAVLFAVILSLGMAAPTFAARYFNADTNQWEDRPVATPRHYKAIPRTVVPYDTKFKPGTIVIETSERFLYFVLPGGQAMRYGIGVGRQGFEWQGQHAITRKAEWPGWTPPVEMRQRVPDLPAYMPGGPDNPLGARALYIGATLYRIHGTSEPWTIGQAVSSGCIRLTNEDIIDLYDRVKVGSMVVVHQ